MVSSSGAPSSSSRRADTEITAIAQLHLATCVDNIPHVSLMNYTYLPSSPYSSAPVIVMTTNPASKKMNNLVANPNVSLLVHDCKLIPTFPPSNSSSQPIQGYITVPRPPPAAPPDLLLAPNTPSAPSPPSCRT